MKLTVKTDKLKEMVSRAVKGASNNKLIPITSLMAIELQNGLLRLITTDATNYLYIKEDKVVGDDFYVTVSVDVFSKLISKMTSENVTLNLKEDVGVLEVSGNGKYRIELPVDENGQFIKYPDPLSKITDFGERTTINRSTIQVILETIKPALAVTLENPCYTGYYLGDKVVATDTYKIASMNVQLFDEPKLVSAELLDLLSVMATEKIDVSVVENKVIFTTPDCVIYGVFMEGIEEYAIDAISELIDSEFDSKCTVSKDAFLQLIDRLSLFVGTYDKGAIRLTFTQDGIHVSSKSSSGEELIKYSDSENFESYTCVVDVDMLKSEVKAIQADALELYYGSDSAIKFVDGNITIIVALLDEDEDDM